MRDGFSQPVESSTPVRSKRNPRKWEKNSPDVVDLLESDDESVRAKLSTPRKDVGTKVSGQYQKSSFMQSLGRLTSRLLSPFHQAPKSRIMYNVPVIAVGKKLFEDCHLILDQNQHTLELFGKAEGRTRSRRKPVKAEPITTIDLKGSSLKAIKKYYPCSMERSDLSKATYLDVQFSFLAFKLEPDKLNDLKRYTNAYKFDPDPEADHMSYVVVRFESNSELSDVMNLFGEHLSPEAASRCVELITKIDDGIAHMYAAALLKPTADVGGSKKKVTDSLVAGRSEDDILLVYPFAGNEAKIEEAAAGLNEARGVDEVMGLRSGSGAYGSDVTIATRRKNKEREVFDVTLATEEKEVLSRPERRHFLTIQVRDFVRLCPGEFLNDSLIDFWIQW